MFYLLIKTGLSAIIITAISEIGKRSPGFAALVASLPLVSILGMIWLWRDTNDVERLAVHSQVTFWYVLPSLPMFLILPALLRHNVGFLSCYVSQYCYYHQSISEYGSGTSAVWYHTVNKSLMVLIRIKKPPFNSGGFINLDIRSFNYRQLTAKSQHQQPFW